MPGSTDLVENIKPWRKKQTLRAQLVQVSLTQNKSPLPIS
jgi:hypothetical protein